jgi:hypothetical protein
MAKNKKRKKKDKNGLQNTIEAQELHKTPGLSHSLLKVNQLLLH